MFFVTSPCEPCTRVSRPCFWRWFSVPGSFGASANCKSASSFARRVPRNTKRRRARQPKPNNANNESRINGLVRSAQRRTGTAVEITMSTPPMVGTPTMGGVLIVISTAVPVLLWADLTNPFILLSLFALFGFAVIGFIDDYAKVSKQRNLGLTAKKKIYFQVFVSLIVGVVLLVLASNSAYSTQFVFPFLKRFHPDLVIHSLLGQSHFSGQLWPLAFVPFLVATAIVIVGSSNAVNLTDGLDGLAIGCTVIAAGALAVLTYVSSNYRWA